MVQPTTSPVLLWTTVSLQVLVTLAQLPIQDDGYVSVTTASSRPSSCSLSCEKAWQKAVCGTDGRTYNSRCELWQAQCDGETVQFKHRGKCSDKRKCFVERAIAQRLRRKEDVSVYIPACRSNGGFEEIQCHVQTSYCWCVTDAGKPIPGSSVRYKRPNCSKNDKSNTRRRSSRRRRKRRGCSTSDRSAFNSKLIEIFTTEYKRLPSTPAPSSWTAETDPLLTPLDKSVIEWKFSKLDDNGDNILSRKEIRALRRMVVKIVKPRRCAKTFTKVCDRDQDAHISRREWSFCLGVDNNNESLEERGRESTRRERPGDETPTLMTREHINELMDAQPTKSDPLEVNDCLTDRKNALEDQSQGNDMYMPECTSDGRYQQVQCYKSTGYCWCVVEDTGRPIPGTSVKNDTPNCEHIPGIHRPMKGCPGRKKTQFLTHLMDYLNKVMMASIANSTSSSVHNLDPGLTLEEQIARWQFTQLDTNANQILERKEWKVFRNSIMKQKTLKRCGKKLPRYCDVNADKKISLEEWRDCLGAKKAEVESSTESSHSRRRGPNPLRTYLKSDD